MCVNIISREDKTLLKSTTIIYSNATVQISKSIIVTKSKTSHIPYQYKRTPLQQTDINDLTERSKQHGRHQIKRHNKEDRRIINLGEALISLKRIC